MGIFGEDPRDLFIASQKEEIQYLRGKVDELQRELLAMTSTSAYRLVHKDAVEPEGAPVPLNPMQMRHAVPSKEDLKTAKEIAANWPTTERGD